MRTSARKIQTLARLGATARKQALVTLALMAGVRIALWIVPFRALKRLAETSAVSPLRLPQFSEAQVAWAVRLAGRYIPKASCLTQALTAQILLNASGHENRLHIGVARESGFKAHAWIECAGEVLVGGQSKSAGFAPILTFQSSGTLQSSGPELKTERIL